MTIGLADPMVPRPLRIVGAVPETADTVTLELERPPGYTFRPGQFNMLYVFGIGEVAISISGDPAGVSALVHTVRAVGAVTAPLAALGLGASMGVRGPYGSAWPIEAAEGYDVVVVAGGIGLAPLRPAIYRLLERRDRYGRVAVLYGARTPGDRLYPSELEAWSRRGDVEVRTTVDRADPGWRGHVGVVTTLFPGLAFDPARTVGLVCGPEVMMRFVAREFLKRGVPAGQVHVSMERNMKCAVGFCGHCQYGPTFVCKDGPVYPFDRIAWLLDVREV